MYPFISACLNWLGNAHIVMFSISTVHIWQAAGAGMILFIAGLVGISRELYESAEIEGANAFSREGLSRAWP